MKTIITILADVAIINALIAYACCVVAGRADEEIMRMNEEENT